MAIIKGTREETKIRALKEKGFNGNFPPLFDVSSMILDDSFNKDENNAIEVPKANLKDIIGVTANSFVEKPPYIPQGAFVYPLDKNLYGVDSSDFILNDYKAFKEVNISNIDSPMELFSDKPLINNFGAQSSDAIFENILEDFSASDWSQNENITYKQISSNIVMDPNGLSITNNYNDTDENSYDIIYRKTIRIEKSTSYCFSGFFRLYGNTDDVTHITGLYLVPEGTPINEADPQEFYETHYITSAPISTYDNRQYREVDSNWNSIACTFRLDPGRYDAMIFWHRTMNGKLDMKKGMELRVAGIKLHEGVYPYPFDYRKINDAINGLQAPLLFNFNKLIVGELTATLDTTDWTIVYKRYLKYSPDTSFTHFDVLGSVSFGIQNGKMIIVSQGGINESKDIEGNIYSQWGLNILKKEGSKLTFRMIGSNYDQSIECNIPFPIDILSTELSDGVFYNLSLGFTSLLSTSGSNDILEDLTPYIIDDLNEILIEGWRDLIWPGTEFSGSRGTVYAGIYRDLMFIPRVITEYETDRLLKDLFALSEFKGINNLTDNGMTMRMANIKEGRI